MTAARDVDRQKQPKAKRRKPKKKTAASEDGLPETSQRAEPARSVIAAPSEAQHVDQRNAEHQHADTASTVVAESWRSQSHVVAGSAGLTEGADPAERWRVGSADEPQPLAGSTGHEGRGASDGSDETSDVGRLAHRLGAQWVITPAAPAAVSTVTSLRNFRPVDAPEADGGGDGLSDEAGSDESDDDDKDESLSDADSDVSEDFCSPNAAVAVRSSIGVSDSASTLPQRPVQAVARPRARAPTSEVAAMSDVITRFMGGTYANESFQVPHAAAETAQLRLWRGEDGAVRAQTPSGLLSVTLQWTFHTA